MSRLIDKLHAAAQAASSPLGFGKAARAVPKPSMLLIASLAPAHAEHVAESAAGADAGLWRVQDATRIKPLVEKPPAKPDIPWGLWLPDADREETERVAGGDFDFVVFSLKTSLGVFNDEATTGYVLQVDTSVGDGVTRAIESLPVDAVLLNAEASPFVTWHHLLLVRRFASLLDRPLLFALPESVTESDLQMLWEAGVDGVVADAAKGDIPTLRKYVEKVREPPPRKRAKPGVLLPRVSSETAAPVEEEEGEGDDEE